MLVNSIVSDVNILFHSVYTYSFVFIFIADILIQIILKLFALYSFCCHSIKFFFFFLRTLILQTARGYLHAGEFENKPSLN